MYDLDSNYIQCYSISLANGPAFILSYPTVMPTDETQAHWCEHVDRTVPSEVQIDKDDTNKPGPEVGATLEMDRGNNSSGAPKLNPLLSTLVIVVLAAMSVA